jgi:hypothetical protein
MNNMFSKITYKIKYKLFLALLALSTLLIYKTAIAKTISLYFQNKELAIKIEEASNAPERAQLLKQKLYSMDKFIQSSQSDTSQNVHDLLLESISSYCKEKKIILKSFPETFSATKGEFDLQTHIFSIQGNFSNLLNLLYLLEQKWRTGKVSSVNFQCSKDIDSKQKTLISTVYLQNVKKIKQ